MKNEIRRAVINSKLVNIFNRYTNNKATIFMLHRFHDPGIGYTWDDAAVSGKYLENCLKYLKQNNYNVVSLEGLISKVKNRNDFKKTVCFTVDDGYVDFKNIAFPLFKKYNYPATVFLTTDFADGMMMWWDQVTFLFQRTSEEKLDINISGHTFSLTFRTLQEKWAAIYRLMAPLKALHFDELSSVIAKLSGSLGVPLPATTPIEYSALSWDDAREMERQQIKFEPHTVTHAILSRLNAEEQRRQIRGSIGAIRKELQGEPEVFCYPNGTEVDFTQDTMDIVLEEGLSAGCTAIRGYFDFASHDQLFQIRRIPFPRRYERFVLYVSGYGACREHYPLMQMN